MNGVCPPDIVAFAHRLADASGKVVRRYFRQPIAIDYKADDSPATRADRETETAIREMIAAEYPEHGVIGEEQPPERADADYLWIVDPIDGTRPFLAGVPTFGTLIALTHKGTTVLGIIDQPVSGERWVGVNGQPTTLNGEPVRTRACTDLSKAQLCTSSPHYYEGADLDALERLRQSVEWVSYGTDCYGFGLIASGCIDIGIESGMNVHDFCALVPVIENAGGVITDWSGAPLTLRSSGRVRVIAAGDRTAHAVAIERLAA